VGLFLVNKALEKVSPTLLCVSAKWSGRV